MPIERPSAGIESAPEHERQRLMHDVTREIINRRAAEWRAVPREQRDATVDRLFGQGRLNELDALRRGMTPNIDNAFTEIESALADRSVDVLTRLETICENLKAALPDYGEEPDPTEHPYLKYSTVAPLNDRSEDAEPLSLYQVNESAIRGDIAFMKELRSSFPGASHEHTRAAIDLFIVHLEAYLYSDTKAAINKQVNDSIPDSMMDKGGRKLGRIALIGVLAAGTAIFGTVAAVNFARKLWTGGEAELSLTPFLWAFATWFVADGDLLKSMFGSQYDREFSEIRNVTSNDTLQQLCRRYDIRGERWKNVALNLYEDDPDVEALLATDDPTDQQVEDAVGAILPPTSKDAPVPTGVADPVAEALRTMMRTKGAGAASTHFRQFVTVLRKAESDEAREFIVTYIERDCANEGMRHDAAAGRTLRTAAGDTM